MCAFFFFKLSVHRQNRAKCGSVCVANHTTPIDIVMLAVDNSFTLVSELVAANILSVVICCTQASQMDLILYLAVMYFFVTLHAYTVLQGVVTNDVHVHAPVVASSCLTGQSFH